MAPPRSAHDVARLPFTWEPNSLGNNWSLETLRTAYAESQAKSLQQIASDISSIRSMLQALGHDGIHDLIRISTRSIRRGERMRKTKLRNARKSRAAPKVAA